MLRRVRRKEYAWVLFYRAWMESEGIPIYEAKAGVEDIKELPRKPWARLGGLGTFIELQGTIESGSLLYVAEIPAGGALEPEKHLYNEVIYILQGRGLTEVWHEGQPKCSFEWGEGSLFAIPTNAWHRLVNGGRQPALFFAKTNAPVVMNAFVNPEFIFNCDYNFTDRFTGKADYFVASERRYEEKVGKQTSAVWETNFIPDVREAFLDKSEYAEHTSFRMANWPTSHAAEWPVGKYRPAHFHGPGAVLLGLKSNGYALVWERRYGIHPYQDGHGDKVIKMNWKPGSIYCVFDNAFHQHFNTGPEPARHLALRGGGHGFDRAYAEGVDPDTHEVVSMAVGMLGDVRDGGSRLPFDDEDPEIRRMFVEELKKKGVEFTMKPVVYRTDPFEFSF